MVEYTLKVPNGKLIAFFFKEDKPEENWPYGKPGGGAGPGKPQQNIDQSFAPNSNLNENSFLPPQPPPQGNSKSRKYKEALDEYNRINQTVAAINAAESKLKREMALDVQRQQTINPAQNNSSYHDQSRVPAAMRTSINFGVEIFFSKISREKKLKNSRVAY